MDNTLLKDTVRSIRDRAHRFRFYSPMVANQLFEAADAVDSALQKTFEQESPPESNSSGQALDDERAEEGNAFNNIWCYRTMPHPLYDDE